MTPTTLLVVVAVLSTLIATMALTAVVRRVAIGRGMLDRPNARSSHTLPTPRGGGLAIVAVSFSVLLVLLQAGVVDSPLTVTLLIAGPLVALLGLLDDMRGMSVRLRLLVQFAVVAAAALHLGRIAQLDFGLFISSNSWLNSVLGIVGLVWFVNLFNFMDGIDGIAGAEGASVAAAAAVLIGLASPAAGVVLPLTVISASAVGFLCWNWAPARIFMGDVGSTYLGFVLGIVAWSSMSVEQTTPWFWTILGGTFIVDATVTLLRRWLRKANLAQAHRSHAYQRLSRRLGSHSKVTTFYVLINLLWLDPLAFLALQHPHWGCALMLIAGVPLVVACWFVGAGTED